MNSGKIPGKKKTLFLGRHRNSPSSPFLESGRLFFIAMSSLPVKQHGLNIVLEALFNGKIFPASVAQSNSDWCCGVKAQ